MPQLKTIRLTRGETRRISNQWAAEAEAGGTTVSSSTWETTLGTLTAPTLASTLATVLLAEGGSGVLTLWRSGTLTNTVTLADGQVLVADRLIEVR